MNVSFVLSLLLLSEPCLSWTDDHPLPQREHANPSCHVVESCGNDMLQVRRQSIWNKKVYPNAIPLPQVIAQCLTYIVQKPERIKKNGKSIMFWVHCKPDLGLLTFKTSPKAINLLLTHEKKSHAGPRKQVFFLDLLCCGTSYLPIGRSFVYVRISSLSSPVKWVLNSLYSNFPSRLRNRFMDLDSGLVTEF